MGLVNDAMVTIKVICSHNGAASPDLPAAVTVQFDTYSGPTLPDGTVLIAPSYMVSINQPVFVCLEQYPFLLFEPCHTLWYATELKMHF